MATTTTTVLLLFFFLEANWMISVMLRLLCHNETKQKVSRDCGKTRQLDTQFFFLNKKRKRESEREKESCQLSGRKRLLLTKLRPLLLLLIAQDSRSKHASFSDNIYTKQINTHTPEWKGTNLNFHWLHSSCLDRKREKNQINRHTLLPIMNDEFDTE